jgi:hypothetical protein
LKIAEARKMFLTNRGRTLMLNLSVITLWTEAVLRFIEVSGRVIVVAPVHCLWLIRATAQVDAGRAARRSRSDPMTTLVFRDDVWDVVTNAWTVASKDEGSYVTLCYTWAVSQMGATRTTLPMTMPEFLQRIAKGGVVDLR